MDKVVLFELSMVSYWVLCLCVVIELVLASDRPIIGILSQEIQSDDPNKEYNYTSYLPSAYVKAVEASGGRVVPVFIRRDVEYYRDLASKVNGFVFTGGDANLMDQDGVARTGKIVLDIVLEMNHKGDHVPILGVCQGMELLAILSNGWEDLLTKCNVLNEELNLKFVPGFKNSSLYKDSSDKVLQTLSHFPSTANHHGFCLTQKNLTRFNLTQWRVLSTSRGANSIVFISSMEWRSVPIAGVQFHPEKSPYEWEPNQANPHDARSIQASRLFYDWIVRESRLNHHSFQSPQQEQDVLMYNYNPIYTGKQDLYNEQTYYFIDEPGILENTLPQT